MQLRGLHDEKPSLLSQALLASPSFQNGAEWMGDLLSHIREEPFDRPMVSFTLHGCTKYALSCCAGLLPILIAVCVGQPMIILLAPILFYAVEVQFVFLF